MTALTLTKAQAQAAPYSYTWSTRGSQVVVEKQIGSTRLGFVGADDTAVLARVNAHEGYRVSMGLGPR
jgi:hypothetical protein